MAPPTVTASRTATRFVRSADGTRLAHTLTGRDPALVLVDGELGSRAYGPGRLLAEGLADRFTVLTYDRRGRHESGDATTYHPDRETDDLAAVVAVAAGVTGGPVGLYGASSGAVLVLRSLARLAARLPVSGAVVHEPPVVVKGPGGPIVPVRNHECGRRRP